LFFKVLPESPARNSWQDFCFGRKRLTCVDMLFPVCYATDYFDLRSKIDMETTAKPFEVIAKKFKISNESAKYFLLQVQRSFKTEKPPQQMIIDFMTINRRFKVLPHPHQLATMLNEDGIWVYPLNAAPPVVEQEDDGYFSDKAPVPAAPKRPRPAPRRKLPPGKR
jgi:hypothetical protein